MPQQTRFSSYNIITDDQRNRLNAIAVPISTSLPNSNATLNTYSLYQDVNRHHPPAITSPPFPSPNPLARNPSPPPVTTQSNSLRRRRENVSDTDSIERPPQRRRHRATPQDLPPERRPDFMRTLTAFKDKWNKMFPDKPCVECGTLLLPRNRKPKAFEDGHVYGLTRAFGLPINGDTAIHCHKCYQNPQTPVNAGPLPQCLNNLSQRSRIFFSPFSLNTGLGRTQGYNTSATPFTYCTLTGRITTRPGNDRAVALYSGTIAAWLESNAHNRADQGHDQLALMTCKDWLLAHNPVLQRNDIQTYFRSNNPLPVIHLENEAGHERRPNNRPDLVINPFPYNEETRNEDYRHYRLPTGTLEATTSTQTQPALLHGDPDVELLLFPHLYPMGTATLSKENAPRIIEAPILATWM
jgi:hypothetical protein